MRRSLCLFILLSVIAGAAQANVETLVGRYVPQAQKVGEGRLTYAFWDIYDATLYAPGGSWNASEPYALSLQYFRPLDGSDIADRSVQEMRGQGFRDEVKLAAWNTQLKRIFPDVNKGTVLSAIYTPREGTKFFRDSESIGEISGDEFARHFFAIWLGEKTSEPALRRRLLGSL